MTADHTLGRIDDTLEAWELGPDAARWAGEPNEGEWEDDKDRLWPMLGVSWAEFVDALTAMSRMSRAMGHCLHEIETANRGAAALGVSPTSLISQLAIRQPPALTDENRQLFEQAEADIDAAFTIDTSCSDQPQRIVLNRWAGETEEAR